MFQAGLTGGLPAPPKKRFLIITYATNDDIVLSKLKITIEDTARNGEIYIDNIRFI